MTVGYLLENIKRQKDIAGNRLKANKPSTRARKRRNNRPQLSLVDEKHRLVQGGFGSYKPRKWLPKGRGFVIGGANSEVRKIMKHVLPKHNGDEDGYNFFGPGPKWRKAFRALLRKETRRILRRRKAS